MFKLEDLKVGMKLKGKAYGSVVSIFEITPDHHIVLTKEGVKSNSIPFSLEKLYLLYTIIEDDFKPLINPHITSKHTCIFKKEKWFSGRIFEYCTCGKSKQ